MTKTSEMRDLASIQPQTLKEWLQWQEDLQPWDIVLGLDRVQQVAQNLDLGRPAHQVIVVGGTNGKGSSVALLESIYREAGYRVGACFSPHLLNYNERIRLLGKAVEDPRLCQAFRMVEDARNAVPLTYFEFGILATLWCMSQSDLDVAVLEVGMGGRLDAVNMVDADAALLTNVSLDHCEWLGEDIETIGAEKACIMRRDCPAVFADPDIPGSVRDYAQVHGVPMWRRGEDFGATLHSSHWDWHGMGKILSDLPWCGIGGRIQTDNAAGVLAMVELMQTTLPVNESLLRSGLQNAFLPGRYDWRLRQGTECLLDVAHNRSGARSLSMLLAECGKPVFGVLGMLRDKDSASFVQALSEVVGHWDLVDLPPPRGLRAEELSQKICGSGHHEMSVHTSMIEALESACARARELAGMVLITGSFVTVSEAMEIWGRNQGQQ